MGRKDIPETEREKLKKKFGLRVKYAPGKGFNQLNFIPL